MAVAGLIGGLMVVGPLIGAALHIAADPSDPANSQRAAEAGAESVERAVEREVRPFLILGWIAERFPALAAAIVVGAMFFFGRR